MTSGDLDCARGCAVLQETSGGSCREAALEGKPGCGQSLIALLARSHVLVEGRAGCGKKRRWRRLAKAVGL
jgi:MoxR-like ATPase